MKVAPKLLIQYSDIYDRVFHRLRKEEYQESMLDTGIEYKKKLQGAWDKIERKAFDVISQVSGLKWHKSVIDCFVVKKTRSFSIPLTLPIYRKGTDIEVDVEYQIETVLHELVHNILVQNFDVLNKGDWKKKYPEISQVTYVHINVHAIMKLVMLEMYGKKRTEMHINRYDQFPMYKKAWEIVEKEGAEDIIKKMKIWQRGFQK